MLKIIKILLGFSFLILISSCGQDTPAVEQSSVETINSVSEEEVFGFSIFVDTGPDHPRNMGLEIFVENLKAASNGRLQASYYSGPDYQGLSYPDVIESMRNSTFDMAVPGLWSLVSAEPNAFITALPMFYGRSPEQLVQLVDGEVGGLINASIEESLNVEVLGRWYDLGHIHLHTTERRINSPYEVEGLRIIPFTSPVITNRVQAWGAETVAAPAPYPSITGILREGGVDGITQSFRVLEILDFVEARLTYSIKDYAYALHYVPMASQEFWSSLPDDLKTIFLEVWDEHVPDQRAILDGMQVNAEAQAAELETAKGGGIYYATQQERDLWRDQLMPTQAAVVEELNISSDLVAEVAAILGL